MTRRILVHSRRLLADERGAALVLALSVLMVMTVSMTTVLTATMANARSAARSNAGQIAYSLAEAGLNNAYGVLNANYTGSTTAYPGDSTLLPTRTTTYSSGSVTWSGSLNAVTGQAWAWEWDVTSIGSARNTAVAGSGKNVTRTLTAVVPVTLPQSQQNGPQNPLNWIYSGTDTVFQQSVTVKAPVYTVGNLTLQNSAKIAGSAGKVAVGGNLTLTTSQNQIGLLGGSDPRIAEAHVVGLCSVKGNVVPHQCGGSAGATNWDSDSVYATTVDHSLSGLLDHTPQLRCCAPYLGAILPAGSATSSEMGFWYKNADLGPLSACTTGSVPFSFDTGDGTINGSSNLLSAINLTPTSSYSCTSKNGKLIWDASAKTMTIKGTVFIDGSITVDSSGFSGNPVFTYSGSGTIVVSGTFSMKGSKLCAVVSGTDCNWTPSSWDPSTNGLVIVADGDGAGGVAQSQGGIVAAGFGIDLVTGTSFQGALIANKSIQTEQNAVAEGPEISVYNTVQSGQTGTISFPSFNFAPAAAQSITSGQVPTGLPIVPRSTGGG